MPCVVKDIFFNIVCNNCCSTAYFHMVVKVIINEQKHVNSCTSAHFCMVVKALESEEWIDECCSTALFQMVVKNVRSIDVPQSKYYIP